MKAKKFEGMKLFIIFILLLVTYSIVIGSVSAAPADPGHSAPSIGPGTFEGGFYVFPNNLSVTQNFSVDTNTLFVDSTLNRIGINTTSPQSILHINGTVGSLTGGISFGDGDSGFYENSDDDIRISIAGTERWYITSSILGSVTASGARLLQQGQSTTIPGIRPYGSDTDTGISGDNSDNLYLITGASTKLTIDSNGDVGIGVVSPGAKLHVSNGDILVNNSATPIVDLTGNDAGNYKVGIEGTGGAPNGGFHLHVARGTEKTLSTADEHSTYLTTTYGNPLIFGTNNLERIRILSTGNVGIMETTPDDELSVNGTANATDFVCAGSGCINAVELNSDVAGLGLNTTSGVLAVNILSPGGGIVVSGDQVVLNQSCSDNEILKWDSGSSTWECSSDIQGGGGGGNVSGSGSTSHVAFWKNDENITYDTDGNFYWNDTENRLGINTTSPSYTLDVNGTARFDTLITPYAQTVIVAKSGGDFTSVQAAIDSITDASASKRYNVLIMPGKYSEQITMKSWVDIRGVGGKRTAVLNFTGNDGGTVILADYVQIQDLRIEESEVASEWAIVGDDTQNVHIRNVDILGSGSQVSQGINITGNTWLTLFIEHCVINYRGTTGYAIYLEGNSASPQNIDMHIADVQIDSLFATTGGSIYIKDTYAGRIRSSLIRTSSSGFNVKVDDTSAGTTDFLLDSTTLEFGTSSLEVSSGATVILKHSQVDSISNAGTLRSWGAGVGDSSQEFFVSDKIGIGTESPAEVLHAYTDSASNTDAIVRIETDDASETAGLEIASSADSWDIKMGAAGDDLTFNDGADRVTFEGGGNVGIGEVNPAYKLEVNGSLNVENAAGETVFFVNQSTSRVGIGTTEPTTIFHIHDDDYATFARISGEVGATTYAAIWGIFDNPTQSPDFYEGVHAFYGTGSNMPVGIRTNNVERVTILNNTGNVGINTTSPNETLSVVGNFSVETPVESTTAFQVRNSSDDVVFNIDTTNERVGIGTASPESLTHLSKDVDATSSGAGNLHLLIHNPTGSTPGEGVGIGFGQSTAGTTFGAKIVFETEDSNSRGGLAFYTKDTNSGGDNTEERLRVTGSGNVGIMETTPDDELTVNGTANATDFVCAGSGCINAAELNSDVAGLGLNTTSGVLAVNILSPGGGIVVSGDQVVLNQSCTDGQILKWDNGNSVWNCSDDTGGGGADLDWTINGDYVYNDTTNTNIGIGNNTPVTKLAISDPSDQLGIIDSDGGQEWRLSANSNMLFIEDENTGAIPFKIEDGADTDTLIIDDSGNVGIGTTGPGSPLHIDASTDSEALFINSSSTSTTHITINNTDSVREYDIGVTGTAHSWGSDKFYIWDETASAGRLVIDSSGNVGINATSPAARLQITGGRNLGTNPSLSSAEFAIWDGSDYGILFDRNQIEGINGTLNINIGSNQSVSMVAGGGNVSIGHTDPDARLHVQGDVCIDTDDACAPPGDGNLYTAGNVDVDGTLYFDAANADGNLDMDNAHLIINIGNSGTDFVSGGGLTLAGAFTANGAVTLGDGGDDIQIDSNDWDISSAGAGSGFTALTVDNIRIGVSGTNEIDTASGNLILDSTGGTVQVDDDLTVSGGDIDLNANGACGSGVDICRTGSDTQIMSDGGDVIIRLG